MSTAIHSEKEPKSLQKQIQSPPEPTIGLLEYWNEGYHYKLIKRKGNTGLYEQFTDAAKPVAFEVILVQSYRGKECPPSTDYWGRLGWSFSEYKYAIKAFDQMTQPRTNHD